jgi:transcription elongation factor GreA
VTETAKSELPHPGGLRPPQGELDDSPARGASEIAKKIEAAREEGDLRENGGYHAAKEEQGKMEARIRQLTQLLETAIIGETPPPDDGIVEPGMVVTVEMFGDKETFLLGSPRDQDRRVDCTSSARSPRSVPRRQRAHRRRDRPTPAPNGKQIEVKILNTSPYAG